MKISELLNEAPLPPDWDSNVFTPDNTYKKRMDYTAARAQKLGRGSSRTAFEIEYQGRTTVLKVAHNIKGMAQNKEEANILDDGYVQQLGITIPIIDYDEAHDSPVWIHMEKAQKATEKQLCNLMKCGTLQLLVAMAAASTNAKGLILSHNEVIRELQSERFNYTDEDVELCEEYAQALTELAVNFNIGLFDFVRTANWGIFNGKPVVIDVGYTDAVHRAHYM
jgi:hypothetical protein